MRITKWIKKDPDFFNLIYLGRSPPSITLDEFIEIKDRIQSNLIIGKEKRGLYHLITGWKGPGSTFNLSDIRLYMPP